MKTFVVIFRWGEKPGSYDKVYVDVIKDSCLKEAVIQALSSCPINSKLVGVLDV